MSNIVSKLNIKLNKADLNEGFYPNPNAVVFGYKNLENEHELKEHFIIDALNNADYYEEDGDFDSEDVSELYSVIKEFGSSYETNLVLEKAIWFDKKEAKNNRSFDEDVDLFVECINQCTTANAALSMASAKYGLNAASYDDQPAWERANDLTGWRFAESD
jgi:hypothetical protein